MPWARDLAMSTRAMQRLLRDQGTSFRQLLDEVRNEHARGYLSSTAFSDGEVSFLLGSRTRTRSVVRSGPGTECRPARFGDKRQRLSRVEAKDKAPSALRIDTTEP
jgi:AraC-like DNA-binding protein